MFFSWGNFGDCNDRMIIPVVDGFEDDNSVEHIQIYQDKFAIISTSDGILKVAEFFPNEIIGMFITFCLLIKYTLFASRNTHIKFY